MLICHCRAVNEAAIRATILAGAQEVDEVARLCGAGEQCGGCVPALVELLAAHRRGVGPHTTRSSAA